MAIATYFEKILWQRIRRCCSCCEKSESFILDFEIRMFIVVLIIGLSSMRCSTQTIGCRRYIDERWQITGHRRWFQLTRFEKIVFFCSNNYNSLHFQINYSVRLAIIINELTKAFPDDPVIGEEDAAALRGDSDAAKTLKNHVVSLTRTVVSEMEEEVCFF